MVDSRSLPWLFPPDGAALTRRNRVLLVLALVAAVFLVVRAARKDDGVLQRNREFGARFLRGEDPYFDPARGHRIHGPYPPSYVIVTAPLALAPEGVARTGWAIAQIAALALSYVLMRRWLSRGWPSAASHAPAVFALALLLASRFLLRDMAGGGGNLLYATMALWGIEFAWSGSPLAGGALLALSLACKPNLAPLVVFLACTGRFRAVLACVVVAAALCLAPAAVFGFEAWIALGERWLLDLVAFVRAANLADPSEIPDGFPLSDTTMNQSVREALWRVLTPEAARSGTRIVSLALVATASWIASRARTERENRLAAALFLPVCVLISPIAWKAHHVVLLVFFGVLVAEAWAQRRKWLGMVLVVYYGTCVLLSEDVVGKDWKNTLQALSVVTLGAIALFVAGVVVARGGARGLAGASVKS